MEADDQHLLNMFLKCWRRVGVRFHSMGWLCRNPEILPILLHPPVNQGIRQG